MIVDRMPDAPRPRLTGEQQRALLLPQRRAGKPQAVVASERKESHRARYEKQKQAKLSALSLTNESKQQSNTHDDATGSSALLVEWAACPDATALDAVATISGSTCATFAAATPLPRAFAATPAAGAADGAELDMPSNEHELLQVQPAEEIPMTADGDDDMEPVGDDSRPELHEGLEPQQQQEREPCPLLLLHQELLQLVMDHTWSSPDAQMCFWVAVACAMVPAPRPAGWWAVARPRQEMDEAWERAVGQELGRRDKLRRLALAVAGGRRAQKAHRAAVEPWLHAGANVIAVFSRKGHAGVRRCEAVLGCVYRQDDGNGNVTFQWHEADGVFYSNTGHDRVYASVCICSRVGGERCQACRLTPELVWDLPGARGEAKGLRQRMAWMARDSWRTTMRRGWEDAAEKRFAVWVMHPYPPLDPQSR